MFWSAKLNDRSEARTLSGLRMTSSKTDQLVRRALDLGLLNAVPHFSCTYYPAESPDDLGQSAFQFADFGPNHVTLRFIIRSNGVVILSGCPNQWSKYKNSDIFQGQASSSVEDFHGFTMSQMPTIKETLQLYHDSTPHEDYSSLLSLWAHMQPVLMDKHVEPHMPTQWWKLT